MIDRQYEVVCKNPLPRSIAERTGEGRMKYLFIFHLATYTSNLLLGALFYCIVTARSNNIWTSAHPYHQLIQCGNYLVNVQMCLHNFDLLFDMKVSKEGIRWLYWTFGLGHCYVMIRSCWLWDANGNKRCSLDRVARGTENTRKDRTEAFIQVQALIVEVIPRFCI